MKIVADETETDLQPCLRHWSGRRSLSQQ